MGPWCHCTARQVRRATAQRALSTDDLKSPLPTVASQRSNASCATDRTSPRIYAADASGCLATVVPQRGHLRLGAQMTCGLCIAALGVMSGSGCFPITSLLSTQGQQLEASASGNAVSCRLLPSLNPGANPVIRAWSLASVIRFLNKRNPFNRPQFEACALLPHAIPAAVQATTRCHRMSLNFTPAVALVSR